jgi:PAS domain S-box-containing protein
MRPKTPTSIRYHLTCLVVAAVLPVWLASGVLVFHAYCAKRDQLNDAMLDRARSLSTVVDRELTSVQAALLALATSPTLAARDFRAVQRQAAQLLKSYPDADIVLADSTGQQLVNTFLPYGTPLPKRKNVETVRRIFATGRPVVSDLFYGTITRRPLLGIDVPVVIDGTVAYDLAMTFPADRLTSVLLKQPRPRDQYVTILDSELTVVWRSRNPTRFVGRTATARLRQALTTAPQGTVELLNLEGTLVLGSYHHSELSGWSVMVGVPKAAVMAELYRWIGVALAGVAGISAFGIALAVIFARRIARAIQSLVAPALTIGGGGEVGAFDTHAIRETGAVAAALVQASDLLQSRHGALLESERRYSALFNNKISGVAHCRVVSDDQGRPVDYWILQINEAYERIIGITKADIEGRRVREVFPGVEQFAFDYIGVLGRVGLEGGEIMVESLLETTGQYLSISAYSPGPGEFTAIFTDVTEHKQAENALSDAIAEALRFREALDYVPAYIYLKDTRSCYTFANRPTLELFGCSGEDLVGSDDYRFFPAEIALALREIDARVFQGRQTTEEIDVIDAAGVRRVYLEYKTPVYEHSGNSRICGLLGISTDITDRKCSAEILEREVAERTASLTLTNQQLRTEIEERSRMEAEILEHQQEMEALTQELSMSEERERGRIAGELHDQVGQHLILGKMKIQWLANELTQAGQVAAAEDVDKLLSQAIQDIRSLTFQLRPPILANAGLEAAIMWLGEELRESYGLRTAFMDDLQPKPLKYEVRSIIFQAVREFLLNVVKHSGCNLARIDMKRTGEWLNIEVADDGKGFDPAEAALKKSAAGGFGLFNVRKRIDYLGGRVVIETGIGKGTRVTLMVPLELSE